MHQGSADAYEINNSTDMNGRNLLLAALTDGKDNIVETLIKIPQVDVSASIPVLGLNIFHFLGKIKSYELRDEIIKKAKASKIALNDQVDVNGNSALHYACYYRDEHLINLLVKNGGDVNGVNNFGVTPLHMSLLAFNT